MSSLDELAEAYYKLFLASEKKTADIDEKIAELTAERRKIAEPYNEKLGILLKEMQRKVDALDAADRKSFETAFGVVRYRNGYERTSWDTNALLELQDSNPRVWKIIRKFLKTTEVKSVVSFEVKA